MGMALLLTYFGVGIVYYSGTVYFLIKFMVTRSADDFNNLAHFKRSFQGSLGVCWKILGYIFMPILWCIYMIAIAFMAIGSVFRRR